MKVTNAGEDNTVTVDRANGDDGKGGASVIVSEPPWCVLKVFARPGARCVLVDDVSKSRRVSTLAWYSKGCRLTWCKKVRDNYQP